MQDDNARDEWERANPEKAKALYDASPYDTPERRMKYHASVLGVIVRKIGYAETVRLLASIPEAPAQSAEPVDSHHFVQPVPDHCDRIVWQGRYYALKKSALFPISAAPQSSQPVEAGETCEHCKVNRPYHDLDCPVAAKVLAEKSAVVLDGERAWDGDSRESRTAFRNYDTIAEPVSRKTPWQIWRDACAWQARAASPQPTATQQEVCPICKGHSRPGDCSCPCQMG